MSDAVAPVESAPAAPAEAPAAEVAAPAEAPAVAAPAASPETFELPEEVKGQLSKLDEEARNLLLRVGALELDYNRTKATLMSELETRRQGKLNAISDAAKAAKLDLETARWTLDEQRMVLVRTA